MGKNHYTGVQSALELFHFETRFLGEGQVQYAFFSKQTAREGVQDFILFFAICVFAGDSRESQPEGIEKTRCAANCVARAHDPESIARYYASKRPSFRAAGGFGLAAFWRFQVEGTSKMQRLYVMHPVE